MKVLIDIHSKSLFISLPKKKNFLSQVHCLTCKTTLFMGPVINRTRFLEDVLKKEVGICRYLMRGKIWPIFFFKSSTKGIWNHKSFKNIITTVNLEAHFQISVV